MDFQFSIFHQLIAHFFIALELKFHVNDVITASVACKKLAHVIYQLLSTVIYYCLPVFFAISIISQSLNSVPQLSLHLMDPLDIAEYQGYYPN